MGESITNPTSLDGDIIQTTDYNEVLVIAVRGICSAWVIKCRLIPRFLT